MNIKSSSQLVAEALEEIKTINTDEAFQIVESNNCNLIDIRDVRELEKEGRVENSHHIPRGMLEFWLDPNSPYFQQGKLDINKEMVLFCAGGLRSALAAKSLKDMGFEKVSHIDGGFGAIQQSKFKIAQSSINSSTAYSRRSCPQKILSLTINVGAPKTSFLKASLVKFFKLSFVDCSLIPLKKNFLSMFNIFSNLEILSSIVKSTLSFQ